MKLSTFPLVEALVSTRDHLLGQRDEARYTIEINGQPMTADFVDHLTPAIRLELGRRIADVEVQLQQHGVELG